MSGLGGAILGHAGLSALQKEAGLAKGGGLEGRPDGEAGAGGGVDDLLINDSGDHLLINAAGDVRKINNL